MLFFCVCGDTIVVPSKCREQACSVRSVGKDDSKASTEQHTHSLHSAPTPLFFFFLFLSEATSKVKDLRSVTSEKFTASRLRTKEGEKRERERGGGGGGKESVRSTHRKQKGKERREKMVKQSK
jgi:hypothetical protein